MRTFLLKWTLFVIGIGLILPACNAEEQGNVRAEAYDRPRANAVEARPEPVEVYGRWGQLGMQEVRRRYPSAQIIDYNHIGRRSVEILGI